MEKSNQQLKANPNWQSCQYCLNLHFNTCADFEKHLRDKHSYKEGSLVLCRYGANGLCTALQFGDLSIAGYQYHVKKHHSFLSEPSSSWDFYSSSQNLPAVLNDPNLGKQTSLFTKTWGDGFIDKIVEEPSPYLPDITLSHFETYYKRICKRYRRHCRLFNEGSVPCEDSAEISTYNESNAEIPDIFYQTALPLNNANTFNKVFPNLNNVGSATSSARALQEQLSTYLDAIEMKISKQVASKSNAFFHAMLSHDTIMEQMGSLVKLVKLTRENIKRIKKGLTVEPVKLIKLTTCRTNFNTVFESVKLMSTIQQTQPMIQLLLSTSDYVAALDLISSTQKVLSEQLTGIHAFRHLSPQLTEMERLIEKMLNNEFQRFTVTDLNRSLSDESDLPERDKLVSIVSGLLRLKEMEFIDSYKSEAITSIQTTVKQAMIEIICEREENTEIVLRGANTDNTSLANTEGIIFFQRVMPSLLTLLKRISAVANVILEVSQMDDILMMQSDDNFSQEEHVKIEEKLKKMLWSLNDLCNERCANLILPKNDWESININGSQVALLSSLIDNFTKDCETIMGHCSGTLKLALKSFAMKYIQHFHNERKNKLKILLDNERWKATEVPPEIQKLVDMICDNREIPSPLLDGGKNDTHSCMSLKINDESFAVVGTVLLLIQIVCEYCQCAEQLKLVAQYICHCLLELLRSFNSQCYHLVLRARALQCAGLKTITTSNLALVLRALQVVQWILPYVKKHLENLESIENILNGFDCLEKDIDSHKKEIETKIYDIVGNLLSSQLINWDARPPVPSQTFRNISKHLVKLHEALINILPPVQIRTIYAVVHDNFKDKLREQLCKMNVIANGGPQHGIVTSELTFYLQTLRTLQVVTDNEMDDNLLSDIWVKI